MVPAGPNGNAASIENIDSTQQTEAAHQMNPWVIVLAGGRGRRMRSLVQGILGEERPKQYCAFTGKRTMFQHTVDRALRIVPRERIVAVIGKGHRAFLGDVPAEHLPEHIIEQPADRGTAPGVFLALTYVLEHDPRATVLIYPSDHFAHAEHQFTRYAAKALILANYFHDRLFVLGAAPDGPDRDVTWVVPNDDTSSRIWESLEPQPVAVSRLEHAHSARRALELYRNRCLWSTMVVAADARALWDVGKNFAREMAHRLLKLRRVLRAARELRVGSDESLALSSVYEELEPTDFSRAILEKSVERIVVLPMDGVQWSDWDRPDCVVRALWQLGKRPILTSSVAVETGTNGN